MAAGFRRSEDGSLIVFGLFCFLIMVLLQGVALDVMRYESERLLLQNTLDRSILAAADIDQTLDPTLLVRDYFAKVGIDEQTVTFVAAKSPGHNEVTASTAQSFNTWFMKFVGVPTLSAPARGTATEGIGVIEISLALDVSTSMATAPSGSSKPKIESLRSAATTFINTVFDVKDGVAGIRPGSVAVTIVPYAQQTTLGSTLGPLFSLSTEHGTSNCVDFRAAQHLEAAVSPTTAIGTRPGHGAHVRCRGLDDRVPDPVSVLRGC